MGFSFKPLWKQLIDRGMTKEQLRQQMGLSPTTIAKMGRGEQVSMDVLNRICVYLHCSLSDVVEHVPEDGDIK